jgi:hypothetical protein
MPWWLPSSIDTRPKRGAAANDLCGAADCRRIRRSPAVKPAALDTLTRTGGSPAMTQPSWAPWGESPQTTTPLPPLSDTVPVARRSPVTSLIIWAGPPAKEVGMFGSIQPVKNRRAVYAAASGTAGERDAIVDDRYIRRACREFLEALRAYAAFNPEASSSIGSEPTTHRQDLKEIAYENMERALQKSRIYGCRVLPAFRRNLRRFLARRPV